MTGTMDLESARAAASHLGSGNESETEIVSSELRDRLGPLQLSHVQAYIAASRFLSWKSGPSTAQRKLLRRHMRYLAHHKPTRKIPAKNFR
jgi:hypothetical protein